jgi:hypothetical protein
VEKCFIKKYQLSDVLNKDNVNIRNFQWKNALLKKSFLFYRSAWSKRISRYTETLWENLGISESRDYQDSCRQSGCS